MASAIEPSDSWSTPPTDLHEAVRRRAEEIFVRSGRLAGRDLKNWAQAEAEILREFSAATRRTAVVVRVNGVQYVGEYFPGASGGYRPGEISAGAPASVRFEGEKMFVMRGNGTELETRIVNRIG